MPRPTPEDIRAAQRWGRQLDPLARRYTNPYTGKPLTGALLLLKLTSGESGFRSSANSGKAQGRTQFTPGSRRIAIERFGVDPLKDVDSAYHAAALHLLGKINGSKGLEGYNPGMPTYTKYILDQKVGRPNIRSGGAYRPSEGDRGAGGGGPASSFGEGSAGISALLAALGQQKPQIQTAGLQAPSFSAAPVMAGQTPISAGGPSPKPDTSALLDAIRTAGGSVPGGAPAAPGAGPARAPRNDGKDGHVTIAPGADRPGVHTSPRVIDFVQEISSIFGQPLTIGTGSQHDQYVAGTHRESAHWTGRAADIPLAGKALTTAGQDALIAAGMSPRKARKQRGGVFNVGGYQILFNTNVGGNHFNHLHVGLRR